MAKVCPESFTRTDPSQQFAKSDKIMIIEGENIIITNGQSDITVSQQIDNIFKYKVKPAFNNFDSVLVIFDDMDGKELKLTNSKRYPRLYEEVNLAMNDKISDWDIIFKCPQNKMQFKSLFMQRILEKHRYELQANQQIFLNGALETDETLQCSNNSIADRADIQLHIGESDTKIFQFVMQTCEEFDNFVIQSSDSDVKILATYFQAKLTGKKICIKHGSGLIPAFYSPSLYLNYMSSNFCEEPLLKHAASFLLTFLAFGCDSNPGFNGISHGSAMMAFDRISRVKSPQTEEDFLHLLADVYQGKYSGLKRHFTLQREAQLDERLMQTREVIKCFRGLESETIPLQSVLHLQWLRTQYLFKTWTNPDDVEILDPEDFGWKKEGDSKYSVILQDKQDPHYSIPLSLLKGCSCKKKTCGKACSCKKDPNRSCCSSITCKFCQCFEENESVEDEDEEMEVLDNVEELEVFDDEFVVDGNIDEVEIFDEFDTAESGSSDDDDIELETVLERFHFTDEDKESFF